MMKKEVFRPLLYVITIGGLLLVFMGGLVLLLGNDLPSTTNWHGEVGIDINDGRIELMSNHYQVVLDDSRTVFGPTIFRQIRGEVGLVYYSAKQRQAWAIINTDQQSTSSNDRLVQPGGSLVVAVPLTSLWEFDFPYSTAVMYEDESGTRHMGHYQTGEIILNSP